MTSASCSCGKAWRAPRAILAGTGVRQLIDHWRAGHSVTALSELVPAITAVARSIAEGEPQSFGPATGASFVVG